MTHLLIPITDIEAKISTLREQLAKANEEFDSLEYAWDGEQRRTELSEDINGYTVGIIICQQILAGKQISLDEKDIEEKAQNAIDILPEPNDGSELCAYFDGVRIGYKQALKDLL